MAKIEDVDGSFRRSAHNSTENIDVAIPREQLVVITGLSGSVGSLPGSIPFMPKGKGVTSKLFQHTPASFFGSLERPDVDKIEAAFPVIAIEQPDYFSWSPRSAVGTITENLWLSFTFLRASEAFHSYETGENGKLIATSRSRELDPFRILWETHNTGTDNCSRKDTTASYLSRLPNRFLKVRWTAKQDIVKACGLTVIKPTTLKS